MSLYMNRNQICSLENLQRKATQGEMEETTPVQALLYHNIKK